MKTSLLLFLLMASISSSSQSGKSKIGSGYDDKEKYISINPFSIAEPQFAIGPSFGSRFTERSEYFLEMAYVGKTPFYKNYTRDFERLSGARLIVQYRYHFLQQWKPLINFGFNNRRRREEQQPFIGIEFRMKPISFAADGNFINAATNDTLSGYSFSANAFTYGGALIFGNTFNLSRNEKWKLEFTAGIGAKQRNVKLKTVPPGYKVLPLERVAFRSPRLYEETGTVLIPLAIRLRYVLD
jgi:hypothetical protein